MIVSQIFGVVKNSQLRMTNTFGKLAQAKQLEPKMVRLVCDVRLANQLTYPVYSSKDIVNMDNLSISSF